LSKEAQGFWKDVIKFFNISDRHVEGLTGKNQCAGGLFGRIQIKNLCYQKKLHEVLYEGEIYSESA
jgi:hypothetical protein